MGIYVTNVAAGNRLMSNTIFANGGPGIDLADDGVTANDAGDGDTGPNGLQNFPVLQSASFYGSNITLTGTLSSAPSQTYTLEFFANDSCDSSGYGEGQTYLGSSTVNTDAAGSASFQESLNATVTAGQSMTATATDPSNNTSEFSACVPAVLDLPVPTLLAPSNGSQTADTQPVFSWAAIPEAAGYEIQLGTSNPPTETHAVTGTSYTPVTPLLPGTYYWRVRVQGENEWSDTWSVTILAPVPTLVTPTSPPNATLAPHFFAVRTPTLTWSAVSWAIGYRIEIDDDPDFSSPIITADPPANMLSYPITIELDDGIYYWRVQAKRSETEWGNWSAPQSFIVSAP